MGGYVRCDADELEVGDEVAMLRTAREFDGYGAPYIVQGVFPDLVTISRHGVVTHIRREDITDVIVRSR
jgi:hypothetical protein